MYKFRKVQVQESNYRILKEENLYFYNDFKNFANNLTVQAQKSKGKSGKARSYANMIVKLVVIYNEQNNEKILKIDSLESLRKLIKLKFDYNFKEFNRENKGFPNASLSCFTKYIHQKRKPEVIKDSGVSLTYTQSNNASYTDLVTLIKQRRGQTEFRKELLCLYSECILCGIKAEHTLASHIKPWAVSNDKERLDVKNGLLLCPNHDYLFDKGYITFDSIGMICISIELTKYQRQLFHINSEMRIDNIHSHEGYLAYHREYVFRDEF